MSEPSACWQTGYAGQHKGPAGWGARIRAFETPLHRRCVRDQSATPARRRLHVSSWRESGVRIESTCRTVRGVDAAARASIRQPDVIAPAVGIGLDVVRAAVVAAVDQDLGDALVAEFAEGDFLRGGGHAGHCTKGHWTSGQLSLTWFLSLDRCVLSLDGLGTETPITPVDQTFLTRPRSHDWGLFFATALAVTHRGIHEDCRRRRRRASRRR